MGSKWTERLPEWNVSRWRDSETEDEVERETEFLQGDVISWPSSCFIAGTSFCAAESWRTNTHTHTCIRVGVHCGKGRASVPTTKQTYSHSTLTSLLQHQTPPTDNNHKTAGHLSPVKSHPSKDGLGDACSLQFLPHTLVDVTGNIALSWRRARWSLGLRCSRGASV